MRVLKLQKLLCLFAYQESGSFSQTIHNILCYVVMFVVVVVVFYQITQQSFLSLYKSTKRNESWNTGCHQKQTHIPKAKIKKKVKNFIWIWSCYFLQFSDAFFCHGKSVVNVCLQLKLWIFNYKSKNVLFSDIYGMKLSRAHLFNLLFSLKEF